MEVQQKLRHCYYTSHACFEEVLWFCLEHRLTLPHIYRSLTSRSKNLLMLSRYLEVFRFIIDIKKMDKTVFYMWLCPSSLVFHIANPQTCLFVVQARPCSYDLYRHLLSCAVRNFSPLQSGSGPDHPHDDSDLCGDLIWNRLVCSGWERNLFLSKGARQARGQRGVTHGIGRV